MQTYKEAENNLVKLVKEALAKKAECEQKIDNVKAKVRNLPAEAKTLGTNVIIHSVPRWGNLIYSIDIENDLFRCPKSFIMVDIKSVDFNNVFNDGIKETCDFKDFLEYVEYIENVGELYKKFKEFEDKFGLSKDIEDLNKSIDELESYEYKIKTAYSDCKTAFLNDRYGSSTDIVVGKNYYLYDSRDDKCVAFVEVSGEEASGLGYTCIDHEAENKKYYHVRKYRLHADVSGFQPIETITDGFKISDLYLHYNLTSALEM